MQETSRRIFLLSGVTLLASTGLAKAGGVLISGGGGGRFRVPVVSFAERPFQTVVRQEFDFSCGAASAATLLTYHFDRPTTEQEAFQAMWDNGDQDKIREKGFSLLDIKAFITSVGYESDGFRITLDQLEEAGVPAIFLINLNGYRHFVVVKGTSNDTVLVGDPAFGVRSYRRSKFAELWVDEIVFAITNEVEVAQANFNSRDDWKLDVRSRLGTAVSRNSLSSWSVRTTAFPAQIRPSRGNF